MQGMAMTVKVRITVHSKERDSLIHQTARPKSLISIIQQAKKYKVRFELIFVMPGLGRRQSRMIGENHRDPGIP